MKAIPTDLIPRLHTTPLGTVRVTNSSIVVEVDDRQEKRIKLIFQPFQATRVITEDCFVLPKGVVLESGVSVEVLHSPWVKELAANLSQIDVSASFMQKARHFIVPLQDEFLEVIAWNVQIFDASSPES